MMLPSPLPSGLSVREAAVDAGCKTVSACRDRVRKGIMPGGTAVPASLLLRHGCHVDTLRKALTRNGDGSASGPLAHALDLFAGGSRLS
jgi:hypothetical protein